MMEGVNLNMKYIVRTFVNDTMYPHSTQQKRKSEKKMVNMDNILLKQE
jgi:hypothetical protein